MKVEIVREQPVTPPIKEYIVTLTPEEAVLLRSLFGCLLPTGEYGIHVAHKPGLSDCINPASVYHLAQAIYRDLKGA